MKIRLLSTTALVLIASAVSAHAGEKAGNGGGAQLCFTDRSHSQEKSIESYDLVQGRRVLRLNIPEWNGTETATQIRYRVLAKIYALQPDLANYVFQILEQFAGPGFVVENENVAMTTIPLTFTPVLEVNCIFKQLVIWYDPGQYSSGSPDMVLRDQTHYASGPVHLDVLNRTALDFHEAIYKAARVWSRYFYADTSDNARDIQVFVAEAFSDAPIVHRLLIFDPVIPVDLIGGKTGKSLNPVRFPLLEEGL